MTRRSRLTLREVRDTSTFRLTLVFGLVFAAGMAALLALVYLQTARELTGRSDRILRAQAAALRAVPAAGLPGVIHDQAAAGRDSLSYAALFASDGDRVAGDVTRPRTLLPGVAADATDSRTGRPLRLLAIPTPAGETILVGRDLSQITDFRHTILAILLWTGALVAVAEVLVGVLLSLRPLRRVRNLAVAARDIGRGDLSRRMPLTGRRDELDTFAATVNVMIEQVERVVAQVKAVTDAMAHDLRTPLTRLRTRLQQLARDGGTETREQAAAMLADLDQVLERFAALLRISELEAAGAGARFAPTDLAPLLAGVGELYEPLAEERGQVLRVDAQGPALVEADRELLFEALSNLVDNAIKFTPAGGAIELALARAGTDWVVSVRDSGPGVPAHERSAVLRRFHRGGNAGGVPGSGLGLSIVAAIAHLHHAGLALEDAAPGLSVRLTLPIHDGR